MRLTLIQQPIKGEVCDAGYAVRHFWFGDQFDPPRGGALDLLLLDARLLSAEALRAALLHVAVMRQAHSFRLAVMIWPSPTLELTVLALRSGIRDVLVSLPTLRKTLRLLRKALPPGRRSRSHIHTLLDAGRVLIRPISVSSELETISRDKRETQRKLDALAREELRIQGLRASMEAREIHLKRQESMLKNELRDLQEMRVDSQNSSAAELGRSFEKQLQDLSVSLERKARALEAREQMLREMEELVENAASRGFSVRSVTGSPFPSTQRISKQPTAA